MPVDDAALTVNYGLNRVRFPSPVPSGSRVRARFRVEGVEEVTGGTQVTLAAAVEREGAEKPVCVAELVFRFLTDSRRLCMISAAARGGHHGARPRRPGLRCRRHNVPAPTCRGTPSA